MSTTVRVAFAVLFIALMVLIANPSKNNKAGLGGGATASYFELVASHEKLPVVTAKSRRIFCLRRTYTDSVFPEAINPKEIHFRADRGSFDRIATYQGRYCAVYNAPSRGNGQDNIEVWIGDYALTDVLPINIV